MSIDEQKAGDEVIARLRELEEKLTPFTGHVAHSAPSASTGRLAKGQEVTLVDGMVFAVDRL